jgi:hypothetical protein
MKINDLRVPPRRKDCIGMAVASPTDSIELFQRHMIDQEAHPWRRAA